MINAHPFPIFEAPALRRSVDTLRAPAQNDEHELLQTIRKKIFAPLCEAIAAGPAQKLASGRRNNDSVFAIAAGESLFPIVVARGSRASETMIFPPVARDRVSQEYLREASGAFADMGSQRYPSWKQEELRTAALDKWLSVFYSGRRPQAATLYVKDRDIALMSGTDVVDEGTFAREAVAVVDLMLRTAQAPQAVAEKSLFGGLFGLGSSSNRALSLSDELRNLGASRLKATEVAGPPVGLADDLCSVAVWRDRVVALTSQRGEGGRTRLWIEDSVNGRSCFREIATPDALPPSGVAMTVIDDEVRLYGGAHTDGSTSDRVWTYPLTNAGHYGFPGDLWRPGTAMAKPAAWPVIAVVDRSLYVTDGVSKLVEEKQGDDLRMPLLVRGFRKLQHNKWIDRSAPPEDTTGASVAGDRRVFVVGPGNVRDGKLYLCDTAQGEKWYSLPALPNRVGMGQVFLSDDKITYAGGFDAEGKPSKEIYQLDLNSLSGRWEHVGSSPYVAGRARIVRRRGQLVAIMVTPTASRMYEIGG